MFLLNGRPTKFLNASPFSPGSSSGQLQPATAQSPTTGTRAQCVSFVSCDRHFRMSGAGPATRRSHWGRAAVPSESSVVTDLAGRSQGGCHPSGSVSASPAARGGKGKRAARVYQGGDTALVSNRCCSNDHKFNATRTAVAGTAGGLQL